MKNNTLKSKEEAKDIDPLNHFSLPTFNLSELTFLRGDFTQTPLIIPDCIKLVLETTDAITNLQVALP